MERAVILRMLWALQEQNSRAFRELVAACRGERHWIDPEVELSTLQGMKSGGLISSFTVRGHITVPAGVKAVVTDRVKGKLDGLKIIDGQ